jgi:hypothetical protein
MASHPYRRASDDQPQQQKLYFSCLQETWRLVDGRFVEEGLLSAADVAASTQAHADPSFQYRDLTLDAAWGRRLD